MYLRLLLQGEGKGAPGYPGCGRKSQGAIALQTNIQTSPYFLEGFAPTTSETFLCTTSQGSAESTLSLSVMLCRSRDSNLPILLSYLSSLPFDAKKKKTQTNKNKEATSQTGEVLANNTSDKGLIFGIHKEFICVNNNKNKQLKNEQRASTDTLLKKICKW